MSIMNNNHHVSIPTGIVDSHEESHVVIGKEEDEEEERNQQERFIIGAGLMRTGTTSLRQALKILYGRQSLHMISVWENSTLVNQWNELLDNKNNDNDNENDNHSNDNELLEVNNNQNQNQNQEDRRRLNQWNNLLTNHIAAIDIPACCFYKELAKIYPNAKIILTIRDNSHIWYQSLRENILKHFIVSENVDMKFYLYLQGQAGIQDMTIKCMKIIFGDDPRKWYDENYMCNAYENWNRKVIETIPKERLLIYNVREGWPKLCEFLNISQPKETIEFPFENTKEHFQNNLMKLKSKAIRNSTVALSLLLFVLCIMALFLTNIL